MSATSAHPHPRRWAALLFISIAQLMVFLDSAVMNIALAGEHRTSSPAALREFVA
ncbi:hypothetical protein [Streptomyces sp. NBC_00154]|jgi:hypothetical protein|uniref:hypothetical protein n=1 Tax=Streptomyces sp. NBC_00154 TaxID=2975670 RepID=UPI00225B697B|nr:hypothetical protein [Streptomyces sp. NBC_00154]MCX5316528.1 hypothetical protein [Streptomyces sp. NBC_00154]